MSGSVSAGQMRTFTFLLHLLASHLLLGSCVPLVQIDQSLAGILTLRYTLSSKDPSDKELNDRGREHGRILTFGGCGLALHRNRRCCVSTA